MLNKDRAILIVTDVQGKLATLMNDRELLYRQIGIMIDGARILNIPILWIEQYPEGLGATVPEISSHLQGITSLSKKTFSSLKEPSILKSFNSYSRSQVLIVGIETHVCIYQTAMDLLDRGNEVHVVEDAVSSRTSNNKRIGLAKIAAAGGHITSVETALFEMLEVAEGDAFKKIITLVR